MSDFSVSDPIDVLVLGGGALGLGCASELSLRGRSVAVIDPGVGSASSAAAGMIAPAMEALLDEAPQAHADLFRRGRDMWPEFARRTGVILHREGAEWRGPDALQRAQALKSLGFDADLVGDSVVTADDWRVAPAQAMAMLAARARIIIDTVTDLKADGDLWGVATLSGALYRASVVIVAVGAIGRLQSAPEDLKRLLAQITPIKGQLVFTDQRLTDRAVRGKGAYVAPADGGTVIGATMQTQFSDLSPDLIAGEIQTATGLRLVGRDDAVGDYEYRVGVRGASPDGLPMAGETGPAGLYAALAPRRNGWLLAPLIAAIVADRIEGAAPSQDADTLDPRRFL